MEHDELHPQKQTNRPGSLSLPFRQSIQTRFRRLSTVSLVEVSQLFRRSRSVAYSDSLNHASTEFHSTPAKSLTTEHTDPWDRCPNRTPSTSSTSPKSAMSSSEQEKAEKKRTSSLPEDMKVPKSTLLVSTSVWTGYEPVKKETSHMSWNTIDWKTTTSSYTHRVEEICCNLQPLERFMDTIPEATNSASPHHSPTLLPSETLTDPKLRSSPAKQFNIECSCGMHLNFEIQGTIDPEPYRPSSPTSEYSFFDFDSSDDEDD